MFRYVAIEREYGSGGKAVAERLGRLCGLPVYGREILETAAQQIHIPVEELIKYEESTTNSFLYSLNMIGLSQSADPDLLMQEGHLFVAEQTAIRNLARHGSAVFVGHCAAQALKQDGGVLRVFIKSSPEDRKKRITEEYNVASVNVDNTIRRYDKRRACYYSVNTAKKWKDSDNYDMILDTSTLGIDGCAAAIGALFQVK